MASTSTSRFKPALLAALLLGQSPAVGADLTVAIGDLRSSRGSVHVALYAEAGGFPTREGVFQDRIVRASAPWATFGALPPGTYAVAVYHDENDNGAFDKGLLGLPEEGYGFSNGARPLLGPPPFAQAAFPLGPEPDPVTVSVRLTY